MSSGGPPRRGCKSCAIGAVEEHRPNVTVVAQKLKELDLEYFLNALGELVQRMGDKGARYGLALPGNKQFRNLASRVPTVARERLRFTVYLVNTDGTVEEA